MFSTVMDGFTHVRLDHAEAVEAARGMGLVGPAAEDKVLAGVEDRERVPGGAPGSGHDRRDEALMIIAATEGAAGLRMALAEAGCADAPVPAAATRAAAEGDGARGADHDEV